jgi:hypothetical protein
VRFVAWRHGTPYERGREWVRYDFHRDGSITVHATSTSDDPPVTRDVLYTLGADYRPLESFVRIQSADGYEGSGWFRFRPGVVHAHTYNVRAGWAALEQPITGRVGGFCAHPVSTDALLCAAYDHASTDTRQVLANVFSSSPDPYGRVGPCLTPESLALEYLGQEPQSTPAGELIADRYALSRCEAPDVRLQEICCLAGTSIFLHSCAAGVYGTRYELAELTFVPA